jgi:hypothetical protein
MTALPGAEVYDDPVFFTGYQRMRDGRTGLNEELERPALARLLGPVRSAATCSNSAAVTAPWPASWPRPAPTR